MKLTKRQEEGLKIALAKYKNKDKYCVISGYAGTGKSTLVKFIIEALDISSEKVAYATFTGKAAEVLRKKGNNNAQTLHKLLYESRPRYGGGFYRFPKQYLGYNVIVVDEVSMVPKSMIDLLLTHNAYIIFLGDPFQIPQISKDEGHDLLTNPDIFLDEVMRQAAESEIIQLTMKIRNNKKIDYFNGKEIMIIQKEFLSTGHLTWADQIITATNASRISLNNKLRELQGFEGLPHTGEKMICLRNYWDDFSSNGDSTLVNGTTGIIQNPFETFIIAPPYAKLKNSTMEIIQGNFITEEGQIFNQVNMDKHMILTGEYSLDWRDSYTLGKLRPRIGDIAPRQFTFGYAITAHKAQGSEWDKVLVIEENFPFDKLEHARWLYTACTRASKKLVLMK